MFNAIYDCYRTTISLSMALCHEINRFLFVIFCEEDKNIDTNEVGNEVIMKVYTKFYNYVKCKRNETKDELICHICSYWLLYFDFMNY